MTQRDGHTYGTGLLHKKDMCSMLMSAKKQTPRSPHLESFGNTALMEYPYDTSFDFGLSNWDITALPCQRVLSGHFDSVSGYEVSMISIAIEFEGHSYEVWVQRSSRISAVIDRVLVKAGKKQAQGRYELRDGNNFLIDQREHAGFIHNCPKLRVVKVS